jgi:hypothetical protein
MIVIMDGRKRPKWELGSDSDHLRRSGGRAACSAEERIGGGEISIW